MEGVGALHDAFAKRQLHTPGDALLTVERPGELTVDDRLPLLVAVKLLGEDNAAPDNTRAPDLLHLCEPGRAGRFPQTPGLQSAANAALRVPPMVPAVL
jgi:hypothetical protein